MVFEEIVSVLDGHFLLPGMASRPFGELIRGPSGMCDRDEVRVTARSAAWQRQSGSRGLRQEDDEPKGFLSGICVYFAGFTDDASVLELKKSLRENGGRSSMFFPSGSVTHILAVSLAASKRAAIEKKIEKGGRVVHVVQPRWLQDCVQAQAILPERDYALFPNSYIAPMDKYIEYKKPSPKLLPNSPSKPLAGGVEKPRPLEERNRSNSIMDDAAKVRRLIKMKFSQPNPSAVVTQSLPPAFKRGVGASIVPISLSKSDKAHS